MNQRKGPNSNNDNNGNSNNLNTSFDYLKNEEDPHLKSGSKAPASIFTDGSLTKSSSNSLPYSSPQPGTIDASLVVSMFNDQAAKIDALTQEVGELKETVTDHVKKDKKVRTLKHDLLKMHNECNELNATKRQLEFDKHLAAKENQRLQEENQKLQEENRKLQEEKQILIEEMQSKSPHVKRPWNTHRSKSVAYQHSQQPMKREQVPGEVSLARPPVHLRSPIFQSLDQKSAKAKPYERKKNSNKTKLQPLKESDGSTAKPTFANSSSDTVEQPLLRVNKF